MTKRTVKHWHGATFWTEGWRQKLCRCSKCTEIYRQEDVGFLLDECDTITAYENRGKTDDCGKSQYEQGMAALSSMNRVQQVIKQNS